MKNQKFYSSKSANGPFDVIIIGSGAGGLTAGAMLSSAGKKVLILEQHFQPGGFTHTFTRKNYEWDVGVHYVGKAPITSTWYHQMVGLTDGAFQLAPFKPYTDELYFPDFHILVPKNYADYEQTLSERFPHESIGIKRYFDEVRYIRKKLQLYFGLNLLPKSITRLARNTIARKVHHLATCTTEQVMSKFIQDEKLKAVLDAQWGNIGAPRQHCSFLIHAAMVGNYLEGGAGYPIGGSGIFAKELGRVIYDNGGAIRTKARVNNLIITNNKAQGVRLENGEEILGNHIISTTGIFNTYNHFLADQASCQTVLKEVKQFQPGYEYLNLFIGFKHSPSEFGLGRGNTWIHPNWNTPMDDPTWDVNNLENNPNPKVLFFSSSSLRDPEQSSRKHNGFTGQIVTAAKQGSFSSWKNSKWNHRDEQYLQKKQQITDNLMTLLDEKYPGIKNDVAYTELGTTLTYEHFTASYGGVPYGLASVPARFNSLVTRPTTPVKNLFLAGQDLIMPGVPAAVGSANLCCSLILKTNAAAHWTKKGKGLA